MSKKSKKRKAARAAASAAVTGRRTGAGGARPASGSVKRGVAQDKPRTAIRVPRWAIIAICALLVGAIILGCVIFAISHAPLDLMKVNLAKYATVPENSYKGLTFTTDEPPVTEKDLEWEIVRLLAANKGTAEYGGVRRRWVNISAGDTVELYYRGYRIIDGVREYFSGGCNLADFVSDRTQEEIDKSYIEIGSGKILFERELVGVNTQDYATLDARESGTVSAADVIYITYSLSSADGENKQGETLYLDLATDESERVLGEGFTDFIVGKPIGETISEAFITEDNDTYFDVKVNAAFGRVGGEVLTVECRFPNDYQEPSLCGVTAFFDVFVMAGIEYSVPEFDESFIYEKLKESEDSLKEYSGEGTVEKYKSKLMLALVEARQEKINAAVGEMVWNSMLDSVIVKSLPKQGVRDFYNLFVIELEKEYSNYENIYPSFSQFVKDYFSIPSTQSWEDYVTRLAEEALIEDLVLYTVLRREGLSPSDKAYESFLNGVIDEYLVSVGCTRDLYKTDDEYEVAKTIRISYMTDYYGEDYFKDIALDRYLMDRLIKYVTVIEKS